MCHAQAHAKLSKYRDNFTIISALASRLRDYEMKEIFRNSSRNCEFDYKTSLGIDYMYGVWLHGVDADDGIYTHTFTR